MDPIIDVKVDFIMKIYCSGNYDKLYHGLSLEQLVDVLNSDTLSHRHHPAVCMTRSERFAKSFLNSGKARSLRSCRCVLVLDKAKLSDNYKIVPVSDHMNMLDIPAKDSEEYAQYAESAKKRMKSRYIDDRNAKAEERCYTDIKNISRYIQSIEITSSVLDFDGGQDIVSDIEAEGYLVKLF